MRDETSADASATVHPMGTTVPLDGASVTLAIRNTDTTPGVGEDSNHADSNLVVLELTITAESSSAVLLPDHSGVTVPGTLVPGQAGHHIRTDHTLAPSYLRLAAAYGQARLPADTTVSGLILYRPTEDDEPGPEPDTVSVTLPTTSETEPTTLTWRVSTRETPATGPADPTATDADDATHPEDTEPAYGSEHTHISHRTEDPPAPELESASTPQTHSAGATESTGETGAPVDAGERSTDSPESCPDCDADVKPSYDFCGNCGAPL